MSSAPEAMAPLPANDSPWPEDDDFEELRLSMVPPHRHAVDDDTVRRAVKIVKHSDVVTQLHAWKEANDGGLRTPQKFPLEALFVVMVVCVLSEQPFHLTRVTEIMFHQLDDRWRRQLGIPEPPAENDEKGWKAIYRVVRHRFHQMEELVDPSPMPKNRRLDDATFERLKEERRAQLTEVEWAERRRRCCG